MGVPGMLRRDYRLQKLSRTESEMSGNGQQTEGSPWSDATCRESNAFSVGCGRLLSDQPDGSAPA
jgi:hypothetical protein